MVTKVEAYLQQAKLSKPSLAEKFTEIEDLYSKKLWHQMTLALVELVKEKEMLQGTALLELHEKVLSEMSDRSNPMSLVVLAEAVITQLTDPAEVLAFVAKTRSSIAGHQEAEVYTEILRAQVTLHQLKDTAKTKAILAAAEKMLDEVDGVTKTHGKFYELLSLLHQSEGCHASYYRAALRYLGCCAAPDQPKDRAQLAFYLGLAALLGSGVYNFGELLAHPILEALAGSANAWLSDLLRVFNAGDIRAFEAAAPHWRAQPDLASKEEMLREKIRLLCLMEMAFKRDALNRVIKFEEIAEEASLPVDKVEVMVMRALSLGLIRGSIDQVDGAVCVTWVQPRVLDKGQITAMGARLESWLTEVEKMQQMMSTQAKPILSL